MSTPFFEISKKTDDLLTLFPHFINFLHSCFYYCVCFVLFAVSNMPFVYLDSVHGGLRAAAIAGVDMCVQSRRDEEGAACFH